MRGEGPESLDNMKSAFITDPDKIRSSIDKAYAKIDKYKKLAQECLDAEELYGSGCDVKEKQKYQDLADAYFRKIRHQEMIRLPILKKRLAEALTPELSAEAKPDIAP